MPTKLQSDREFARSVGIKPDRDNCDMCELYAIERSRRLTDLVDAVACIAKQKGTIAAQGESIHMWQLATFAAALMMVLFAIASIHGGHQ